MENKNEYTEEIINRTAEKIQADISKFDMDELIKGMYIELEHGTKAEDTNITNDNPEETFKIMLVHMRENPKYYTDLMAHVEKEKENKKEELKESAAAKRNRELCGVSENESKKQLFNESFRSNNRTLLKEVNEKEFDILEFESTPIEDRKGEEGSSKHLYKLNESLKKVF